jgi:hypothetical protein
MLQNEPVKRWLGGLEPALTLLDYESFTALHDPPSPTAGAIRLATDLTKDELEKSAVTRNALVLLLAASVDREPFPRSCSRNVQSVLVARV